MSYRSKLVGVFGYPVDENPSVIMNEAAFKDMNIDWRYITLLVKPQELEQAFAGLRALNFEGINLTIPHKISALKYVDEISQSAKLIGAINIVVRKNDDILFGDNTDGKGFIAGLQEQNITLQNKAITVLGSGGAARAICIESALAGCSKIHIIARTVEKAKEIVKIINENTTCTATCEKLTDNIDIGKCDILVNATSIGLYPDVNLPNINYDSVDKNTIIQDIIPNPPITKFLEKFLERGNLTINGLSMLVGQGAIGIELWTGQKPDLAVMKESLISSYNELR